jgi:gamma-glutamyltranspeptidase/glutathione hydrolase
MTRLFPIALAAVILAQAGGVPGVKTARGKAGMAATSTPYATAAAVRILDEGGNAVDAAVAACFALMVTDPPMTSLGGRSQTVIARPDGTIIGIDGATQAPAGVGPLVEGQPQRNGFQIVPVPGNPAALEHAVKQAGRLKFAQVMQPAIALAENGFEVTPRLAEMWEAERSRLARDPGAALNFLKPDKSAYKQGEVFRQPRLARLLKAIAASGAQILYRGLIAETIASTVVRGGGFVSVTDLENYRPEAGALVRTDYRGYEVISLGRHAWGNTLVEMLNILRHFPVRKGDPAPEETELLARTIRQAMEDRPQQLGTLRPKPGGHPLELLSSLEFGRKRAEMIRNEMGKPVAAGQTAIREEDHDTTHLSVIDGEGNAVAMTTSIGPRFGSGVATPELGFLYAHSYNIRSNPVPRARDHTEMTPTIVLKSRRPVLAVGAAGSERIPAAIFQVLSNLIDRGYNLERALAAPRLFSAGDKVRIHVDFPAAAIDRLRSLGFQIEPRDRSIHQHLGIVQAVWRDPQRRQFVGAADPVADGAAQGPGR